MSYDDYKSLERETLLLTNKVSRLLDEGGHTPPATVYALTYLIGVVIAHIHDSHEMRSHRIRSVVDLLNDVVNEACDALPNRFN